MFKTVRQFLLAPALALAALAFLPAAHANLTGAVSVVSAAPGCSQVNGNGFDDFSQVFFRTGPSVGGGSNLPNGAYYVRVTTSSGATQLSANVGTVNVAGGLINGATCVQLTSIVGAITPSFNGVYKVWASSDAGFNASASKTEVFHINAPVVTPTGSISVYKFYDANVDGYAQTTESLVAGWKVQVDDLLPLFTDGVNPTSTVYTGLDLAGHRVSEYEPLGNSVLNPYAWIATNAYDLSQPFVFSGPQGVAGTLNSIVVDLSAAPVDRQVLFGNVCIGPAVGGRTLGYWSNKNGQADMAALGGTLKMPTTALNGLLGLNLVDWNGAPVNNFSGNYATFRNWLLNGNAVNMSYMLSVQLSALKLSVLTGKLSVNTMVYAPGSEFPGLANPAGFISIGALIDYAANQLSLNPITTAGISTRVQMEMLKNAIDNINNNRASVAQPDGSHCPALAF